jgi:hypothetical protein
MTKSELLDMISNENDPLKKRKFKDLLEKMELFHREEKPLLDDLESIGIVVESVWDLVNNRPHPMLINNFVREYDIAYPVLLRHLDYNYHPRIQEGIIRALTEKKAKNIATDKLLDMFYKEENLSLKWALSNALKTLMTWHQRQKHPEIETTWIRKTS